VANDTTTFGVSALLAHLRSTAPQPAVEEAIAKCLEALGVDTTAAAAFVGDNPTVEMLEELELWTTRIAPNAHWDRTGLAARRFWAAQTLVTTVLRRTALDNSIRHPPEALLAMRSGADGLLELGFAQWEVLAATIKALTNWITAQNVRTVAIIESPLGNTVPTQLLADALTRAGVTHEIVVWNAPRNDRAHRGRMVKEAAAPCIKRVEPFELSIFMDEVRSGSRFIKLYDALLSGLERKRLLPIAMLAPQEHLNPHSRTMDRLRRRLERAEKDTGYRGTLVRLPALRLFRIDAGPWCKWQTPVIWADSDLIAGKRKVNLIFNLLEHIFDILEDLGRSDSKFQAFLEAAGRRDTSGMEVVISPGLTQKVFSKICSDLNAIAAHQTLWQLARTRYTTEYEGESIVGHDEDAKERWLWLRDKFLAVTRDKLGQRADLAWNAIDCTFAASFRHFVPQRKRDDSWACYVIPFNDDIAAFNKRLRERLLLM
jgi:hypothetical protein